ncbi:MAG: tRNA pseudouridine(38-40) synthase TruA [Chitinophagales bacterium]|nr:tRNA pseudouridine(38-40) synthase TruA [Chitinophagales bacterium]
MIRRVVIELCYNGSRYQGWQIQKNTDNTIQREVNEKLSILFREKIMVLASGRTDSGVHARQNFVHFDTDKEILPDFLRRMNFLLSRDISLKNVFIANENFNARFDAKARSYQYLISYEKNPFISEFSCYYPYPELSVTTLNEAAKLFQSHTDFAAFSKRRTQVKTSLCKISFACWHFDAKENLLTFNITANRFLRGMVRGIVATSIRYARQKITLEDLNTILKSGQPHKTDFSAPAQGLTLMSVEYKKDQLQKLKF